MRSTESLSIAQAPAWLAAKAKHRRIFLPGGPVEPLALARAFQEQSHHAQDLNFCGMMIPGINTIDWAALHPAAQAEVFLPSPDLAMTIQDGRTKVLPLHYSAAYRYLCQKEFKAAVFHVCPPDRNGMCSMSLSADSSPAFIDRDIPKLGIINHALPRILGAPKMPLSLFDALAEIGEQPLFVPHQDTQAAASKIADHVAGIVENGATLQTGIGKLPGAVMASLKNHRGLKLHSGLIGEWALGLLESGAWASEANALTAGVVLGSFQLHKALEAEDRLRLVPISISHSVAELAKIDRFTSINAALEIDLFGQINCEYAGVRTIAGVGGALDFLRGARASQGGKPIIMIASEGKGGVSRILPRLETPTVSIPRSDAPILVTEHGAIDLEPLDVNARAQAIISLAGPSHRAALSKAWESASL